MGDEKDKSMADESSKSLDLFGMKPLGDAVNTLTKGAVDGASAFLGRICLPAAEELGLLFKDRISHWRAGQALKITEKARQLHQSNTDLDNTHAPPRLVFTVIEHGSWIESDEVQGMWAGLLVSSCTKDGKDESNLMFMNLLAQMTTSQAKLLCYGCEKTTKFLTPSGLILARSPVDVSLADLIAIAGIEDLHRLDRELDHLRVMGLIEAGMNAFSIADSSETPFADLMPTSLGLQMYVRCQGVNQSPEQYFKLTELS